MRGNSLKPKRVRQRATQAEMQRLYPNFPKPTQRKTFHAAMGHAIATWQIVEENLYEVYRAATHAQRPGAEAAGFYALGGFSAQLRLTDAAVHFAAYDDATLLKEWTTLYNRADKKSRRRNQIAHGAVWMQFHETRPDRRIYIGPNVSDPRDQIRKPKQLGHDNEPLTLKRVKAYDRDFLLLAVQLRQFARRIPQP